jgi:DNA invertase Pin-like site-specific DNA recombinase
MASPSSFLDDGPTSNLIRQILGAVSEFDKAMTVAKLKGARDRVRRAQGKCEGRKAYAERKGGHPLRKLSESLLLSPEQKDVANCSLVTDPGGRYARLSKPTSRSLQLI